MIESDRVVRCGAFVRRARLRRGLDQADLAQRLGTSQAAISRVERDLVSPKLETLERILNAMGETLQLSTLSLSDSPPGGGNQSISELRADYRLSAEERLAQAAELSEAATQLASEADLG